MSKWLFYTLLAVCSASKLPCEYLTMRNGQLAVDGISLCLGTCNTTVSAGLNSIFLSDGQILLQNFRLLTGPNSFIVKANDGTTLLQCDQQFCFAGHKPLSTAGLAPGFYLTGTAGGPALSVSDPWTISSTVRVAADVLLSQVEMGDFLKGTRIVVNGYAVVITNYQQVLVGEVSAVDILQAGRNTVVVAGTVLVRKATTNAPILRPARSTAILLYVDTVNFLCDLSNSAANFVLTVSLNECQTSPALQNKIFLNQFFIVDKSFIYFFTTNLCWPNSLYQKVALNPVACANGWSAIFIGPA